MWCCNDSFTKAYGAGKDQMLGIPGEVCHSLVIESNTIDQLCYSVQNLEGVYSAREFVGWYNGLPEAKNVCSSDIVCVCIEICNECEFWFL